MTDIETKSLYETKVATLDPALAFDDMHRAFSRRSRRGSASIC
jgi:hypothetical protein